jgi:DNA-binding GntR family transcriptional regulator/flavin reductase (DIM6/NTAB) family NADH-FMN oxidoreductase RutF
MSSTSTELKQIDQTLYRDVVGHFMSGVTVITTAHNGTRFGVTASAVSSLSLDPPMLLVCLNRHLPTADAVSSAGVFAVNILTQDQGDLATQFATRHPDKFRDVVVVEGHRGVPMIAGALAHIECAVSERIDAATHTVFLAEVRSAHASAGSPLAYFRGSFGRFAQALDDSLYRELRERVLSRRVVLGESITIDALAEELDVGRGPVYHALQQLRSEGLISAHPDKGYLVTPLTVEIAWQAYDARAAIECGVVDQSGADLAAPQLDCLHADAVATLPWIKNDRFVDQDSYVRTNAAFHESLVGLAGNATLLHGYRRLAMSAVMTRALAGVAETRDRFTHDHVEIVERLRAKDIAGARQLILDHSQAGKERVKIALDSLGGEY